jgi:hypothetical protein
MRRKPSWHSLAWSTKPSITTVNRYREAAATDADRTRPDEKWGQVNSPHQDDKPKGKRNWRRIHHSPMFWIGIVLCLAAIAIYVLSDDLSWRPRP